MLQAKKRLKYLIVVDRQRLVGCGYKNMRLKEHFIDKIVMLIANMKVTEDMQQSQVDKF